MTRQTEEDFKNHLKEQIGFLLRSVETYDNGEESEAKNMAVTIRKLVYDHGSNSVSLLTHLNKKDMLFYDTARDLDPKDIMSKSTLACLSMRAGPNISQSIYIPNLDDENVSRNVKVPFDDWWEKEVIRDMQGRVITREELVTTVCNKDGGAHIDANLKNETYADLTRNNSFGIKFSKGTNNIGEPIPNVELASIRQIAHEVLKSLAEEFPTFFKDNNLDYSFPDEGDILNQTLSVSEDENESNEKINFKGSKTPINIDTLIDYIKTSKAIEYWTNVIKSLNVKIGPIGLIYHYRDLLKRSNVKTLGELEQLLENSKEWGEKYFDGYYRIICDEDREYWIANRGEIISLLLIANFPNTFTDDVLEHDFGYIIPEKVTVPASLYNPEYAKE
ncbi:MULTISPECIES: hypothetical protein [Methanobacterium]|uniref:Uncharacterized protein n=1 Tax=Methanobacterium veterum TaxID=408577 RepID=A0A9E4ZTI2_9EURY|nr:MULTISPECIES: hypothetical protein [Methanobacterium]MCZ3364894.1 hypothetical protein [Methanobacterium veterum]MCZ3372649.1 hypothetical protein [Methanobacterium veterum]